MTENDDGYGGEEILAMLEQHHIHPEDLPQILLKERNRRRNNLIHELYGRILFDGGYELVKSITDVEILHALIFCFQSSECLLRDELDPEWRANAKAFADEWHANHPAEPAERSTP